MNFKKNLQSFFSLKKKEESESASQEEEKQPKQEILQEID